MSQNPIGERLKILIERLNLNIRSFSQAIGVSEGTTRNYFTRESKPSSDYLEKIHASFESANLHWLLTGKGEPIIGRQRDSNETTATVKKNSGVVGTHGTQYNIEMPENFDSCKQQLAILTVENEGMKSTIAALETALNAKEEILTLLRIQHNRPN